MRGRILTVRLVVLLHEDEGVIVNVAEVFHIWPAAWSVTDQRGVIAR